MIKIKICPMGREAMDRTHRRAGINGAAQTWELQGRVAFEWPCEPGGRRAAYASLAKPSNRHKRELAKELAAASR